MDIKNLKIAVYGLGQVGSSIAAVWLRKGAKVIGVDISPKVINEANNGFINSKEPGVKEVFTQAIKEGRFYATNDGIKASKESNIKFVAVPLIIQDNKIDYKPILDVSKSIGEGLKIDDIVCINTSLPPGTTENTILPTLISNSNLKPDKDFALIYSPERIYIGRAIKDIEENYPIILAGIGEKSTKIGKELYSLINKKGVIIMNSIKGAEFEKLAEGIYRDVNIALANELAILCDKLGIDFWQVREAANSQPYCNIHKAGVGVGGICIPVYPRFIIDIADKVKVECNITKEARMLNDYMPIYCVNEAIKMLNGKKRVSILGLAFRGNVSDTRLSPVYKVIDEFAKYGCEIKLHDPYVNESNIPKNVKFSKDLEDAISDTDLIFIATDHDDYKKVEDYIKSKNIPIYDGRGIFTNVNGIGKFNANMV